MTVVLYSGGIGSYSAARRLIDRGDVAPADLVLLFTDTLIEDEDLYRFLEDSASDLEAELVTIADGRTPWEVFEDEGMIGNTRADLCSRILKRDLSRAWIEEHYPPSAGETAVVIGMDWTEIHRYERAVPRWKPYRLVAPLTEAPYLSKSELLAAARERGLETPRLYDEPYSMAHNNCGGGCVKQGAGAFVRLLESMPARFAEWERNENEFRERTGKDVAILRDRRGGTTKPLTLTALRIRHEERPEQIDLFDIGGCGCGV